MRLRNIPGAREAIGVSEYVIPEENECADYSLGRCYFSDILQKGNGKKDRGRENKMHDRIVKYDLLRIAACFAVVMLHVSGSYWYSVGVDSDQFRIMTIYNGMTRFAVPVFFMLSGLFLLDPEREMPAKKWASKVLKLAAAFYIWSLFYAFQSVLYNGIRNGFDSLEPGIWSNAVMRLVMGHEHMWFLLNLLGFYLLLPVLRKICEDMKVTAYFLALWVLIRFLVVPVFGEIGGGLLSALVAQMQFNLLAGFIGYFLGGYFLNKIYIPGGYGGYCMLREFMRLFPPLSERSRTAGPAGSVMIIGFRAAM